MTDGLFHGAIMQSGADNNPWSINSPDQAPETYVYQTADKANCSKKTEEEMIDCLRNKTAEEIRIAQKIVCTVSECYSPALQENAALETFNLIPFLE